MDFPLNGTDQNTGRDRAKKTLTKVGVIVIILLVLTGLYFLYARKFGEKTEEIGGGNTKTTAEPGKIISDFPKELMIEPGATPTESYSVHYGNDKANQPVLSYVSKESFARNVELVANYLFSNGWQVKRAGSVAERPVTTFYAYRDDGEVNIAIFEDQARVNVSIAYLAHK